ncbi:MAG: hypothetical protein EOO16_15330 [Chitinophagaceae bacterium]|nr:MAG: hypothetical protein EOO16_15330 [Chitinophagaceae bacterium]
MLPIIPILSDLRSSFHNVPSIRNISRCNRCRIRFPAFYLRDMMSLLKTPGDWKIVSKTFYREKQKN